MFCQRYVHALLLMVTLLGAAEATRAQSSDFPTPQATTVRLRWGQQAGVFRYRLQLARDREFADIVFDRVVTGNETVIDALSPGRYFWRIAPLTTKLGMFSSSASIEVSLPITEEKKKSPEITTSAITASGGWRAAVGAVNYPLVAHLRSRDAFDLVGTNSDGVTFALDAMSGVALWSVRGPSQFHTAGQLPALIISSRAGRDNVLICAGTLAMEIEGATGRELWRASLPSSAAAAAVISDRGHAQVVIVDNSLQRLFILSELDGGLLSQVRLPARAFGPPVANIAQGASEFLIAYETGAIELRGATGAVIRAGSTGSPPTTAPIFVRGPRGNLVLIGTRDGLTAMTADELQPLGRVVLKDDAPRGILMSQDLDGDGFAEILMTTARRHVVAVNATDGKIIWDATADQPSAFAFGDINGDGIRDVFIAPAQAFAMALSGRDGSVLWKDVEQPELAANHAGSVQKRALVAVPGVSGLLLIGGDPTLTGLRAVAFVPTSIRPSPR